MRPLTDLIDPLRPHGLCELCRRWSRRALCDDCLRQHAAPVPRCRQCALRLSDDRLRCGQCQQTPPPFEATRCVGDYGFPWDRLINDFKYHERVELSGALALALVSALGPDADWADLIVPVPLSAARQRERGYNQAWELARRVSRRIGRAADAAALIRRSDGPHQARLDRSARFRQMRGAFTASPHASLSGRRIALVDDVLTTGATAAEAARTLLEAGAAGVQVWVIARTP